MSTVLRVPHLLGTLTFPTSSAQPSDPAALADIRARRLADFPAPAIGQVTYFSRAGDPSAGTLAVRDARINLVGTRSSTRPAAEPGQ